MLYVGSGYNILTVIGQAWHGDLWCLQAEWKVAAELFIEKRGYVAAERLRATLQAEWQQLKAIRKRFCGSLPQVTYLKLHYCCRAFLTP